VLTVSTAAPAQPTKDQAEAEREVRQRILRFFQKWDGMWRASEGERHLLDQTLAVDIHCHFAGFGFDRSLRGPQGEIMWVLGSEVSAYSLCPVWERRSGYGDVEERMSIDLALTSKHRDSARTLRRELVSAIRSAEQRVGATLFLRGQSIRFLLDQREFDAAITLSEDCASLWWRCRAWEVLARSRAGQPTAAAVAFRAALADPRRPCEWLSIEPLLSREEAKAFSRQPCDVRMQQSARALWLADPLWVDATDDRAVEQLAREAQLDLSRMLIRDERFSWDRTIGNDARERLLLRYGTPSFHVWPGPLMENEHRNWLNSPNQGQSAENPPYTSHEYRLPRVASIPSWPLVRDTSALVDQADLTQRLMTASDDWPIEHAPVSVPVASIGDYQRAILRRQRGAVVAVAARHPLGNSRASSTDSIAATLLVSSRPWERTVISSARRPLHANMVLSGLLSEQGRTEVSFETVAESGRQIPAARSRFGVLIPASLGDSKEISTGGALGVSDPVLFEWTSVEVPTSDPDSVIPRMLPGSAITGGAVNIYWETYGVALSDTIDVAVWVSRVEEPGLLRRAGRAMRIVGGAQSPTGVSWTEPVLNGRAATVVEFGPVPVIGRSIVLNLTGLSPGDYFVEVAVARPDREPVRGRRRIVISP
jgi:hypothetical protein